MRHRRHELWQGGHRVGPNVVADARDGERTEGAGAALSVREKVRAEGLREKHNHVRRHALLFQRRRPNTFESSISPLNDALRVAVHVGLVSLDLFLGQLRFHGAFYGEEQRGHYDLQVGNEIRSESLANPNPRFQDEISSRVVSFEPPL